LRGELLLIKQKEILTGVEEKALDEAIFGYK
jgi:hypothetical protein